MKCLFVSPISDVWNERKHISLGLGYLAAVVLEAGHEARIFDAAIEEAPLREVLAQEHFDIVGITATTPLIYEAWEAAKLAKEYGAITILGGAHPTLMPQESLERPEVDLVVRGEGEDTLVDIIETLQRSPGDADPAGSGESVNPTYGTEQRLFDRAVWEKVQGISFRSMEGDIIHTAHRPLRKDLDSLPFPAHHLLDISKYTNLQPLTDGLNPNARTYTIVTSRGCPYQCIYCSKAITGRSWRPRSPENVVAEWRWLVRDLKATEIGVTDDSMTTNLDRAKTICRSLIDERLNTVPWITIHGIRAGDTDLELLKLMKQAGCKRVGFGVESGNQRILDSIKKKQTIDEVRRAFDNSRKAGLETMGFFIFGLPGETAETMDDTIQLALELEPDMANFMIAAPYPGTEMYDVVLQNGRLFSHNWRDFAIHDEKARFEIGDVTAELVERKWHEAYRRFYLRPTRIWRKATNPRFWRDIPSVVSNFRRFFFAKKGEKGNHR